MTKDNLPYVFSVVFSVFVAFSTLEADTPDQNIKVQNSVFYEVPITWIKLVRVLRNTVNVWDHMSRVTSRCLEQFKWSACDSTVLLSRFFFFHRVWEGILGIPRDLTKIQSGMLENVRFVDRVRDLTATKGERSKFTKILGKKRYSGKRWQKCGIWVWLDKEMGKRD